ncbi:MAG: hypothetical protein ABL921_04010 [Pirellula sp.]
MTSVVQVVLALAVISFFVWLTIPKTAPQSQTTDCSVNPFIDPDDSYQIGLLTGMTGGSIPDAAVMRYALQRFEQIHGRRATTTDIGIVVGLIRSNQP